MLRFLTENAFSRLHGSVLPTAGINHVVFPGKYLGRTRGVQKCGATPHGSKLSRGALLLALQQSHHHDAGAIVLKHELAGALDEVEEVLGDGYDLHRLRPPSYEAGPASLQAPTGGRYSTPCGTPSPTEVKRTRKPYSESRGFRQVINTTKGRFQCA